MADYEGRLKQYTTSTGVTFVPTHEYDRALRGFFAARNEASPIRTIGYYDYPDLKEAVAAARTAQNVVLSGFGGIAGRTDVEIANAASKAQKLAEWARKNHSGANVTTFGTPESPFRYHSKNVTYIQDGKIGAIASTGNYRESAHNFGRQTNQALFFKPGSQDALDLSNLLDRVARLDLSVGRIGKHSIGSSTKGILLEGLSKAKKGDTIYFTSPFLTSKEVIDELKKKSREGVTINVKMSGGFNEVELLNPLIAVDQHFFGGRISNFLGLQMGSSYKDTREALAAAGIRVYNNPITMAHEKSVAIVSKSKERSFFLVGSDNFSRSSFSDESLDISTTFQGTKEAQELAAFASEDFKRTLRHGFVNIPFLGRHFNEAINAVFWRIPAFGYSPLQRQTSKYETGEFAFIYKMGFDVQAGNPARRQYAHSDTMPFMPTALSPEFFNRYIGEDLPEVVSYQETYTAITGEAAPDAVVAMDRAISTPSLGHQLNRLFGYKFYQDNKGLIGSVVTSAGRFIDTLLGHYEYLDDRADSPDNLRGGERKFIAYMGKEQSEYKAGYVERLADAAYLTVQGTALSVIGYGGVLATQYGAAAIAAEGVRHLSYRGPDRSKWQQWVSNFLMSDEVQAEIDERATELMRKGLSQDEALRQARSAVVGSPDYDTLPKGRLPGLLNAYRRMESSIIERLGGALTDIVVPENNKAAAKEALNKLVERIRKPIEYDPISQTFKNLGVSRVQSIARAIDSLSSNVPLNIFYWLPQVREALGVKTTQESIADVYGRGILEPVIDTFVRTSKQAVEFAKDPAQTLRNINSIFADTRALYAQEIQLAKARKAGAEFITDVAAEAEYGDRVFALNQKIHSYTGFRADADMAEAAGKGPKLGRQFSKLMTTVGAVIAADYVLDQFLLKTQGADLLQQVRFFNAVQSKDGQVMRLEFNSTMPVWTSIGAAAVGGLASGYIFPKVTNYDPRTRVATRQFYEGMLARRGGTPFTSLRARFSKTSAGIGGLLSLFAAKAAFVVGSGALNALFNREEGINLDPETEVAAGRILSVLNQTKWQEGAQVTSGDIADREILKTLVDQYKVSRDRFDNRTSAYYTVAWQSSFAVLQFAALARTDVSRGITLYTAGLQLLPTLGVGLGPAPSIGVLTKSRPKLETETDRYAANLVGPLGTAYQAYSAVANTLSQLPGLELAYAPGGGDITLAGTAYSVALLRSSYLALKGKMANASEKSMMGALQTRLAREAQELGIIGKLGKGGIKAVGAFSTHALALPATIGFAGYSGVREAVRGTRFERSLPAKVLGRVMPLGRQASPYVFAYLISSALANPDAGVDNNEIGDDSVFSDPTVRMTSVGALTLGGGLAIQQSGAFSRTDVLARRNNLLTRSLPGYQMFRNKVLTGTNIQTRNAGRAGILATLLITARLGSELLARTIGSVGGGEALENVYRSGPLGALRILSGVDSSDYEYRPGMEDRNPIIDMLGNSPIPGIPNLVKALGIYKDNPNMFLPIPGTPFGVSFREDGRATNYTQVNSTNMDFSYSAYSMFKPGMGLDARRLVKVIETMNLRGRKDAAKLATAIIRGGPARTKMMKINGITPYETEAISSGDIARAVSRRRHRTSNIAGQFSRELLMDLEREAILFGRAQTRDGKVLPYDGYNPFMGVDLSIFNYSSGSMSSGEAQDILTLAQTELVYRQRGVTVNGPFQGFADTFSAYINLDSPWLSKVLGFGTFAAAVGLTVGVQAFNAVGIVAALESRMKGKLRGQVVADRLESAAMALSATRARQMSVNYDSTGGYIKVSEPNGITGRLELIDPSRPALSLELTKNVNKRLGLVVQSHFATDPSLYKINLNGQPIDPFEYLINRENPDFELVRQGFGDRYRQVLGAELGRKVHKQMRAIDVLLPKVDGNFRNLDQFLADAVDDGAYQSLIDEILDKKARNVPIEQIRNYARTRLTQIELQMFKNNILYSGAYSSLTEPGATIPVGSASDDIISFTRYQRSALDSASITRSLGAATGKALMPLAFYVGVGKDLYGFAEASSYAFSSDERLRRIGAQQAADLSLSLGAVGAVTYGTQRLVSRNPLIAGAIALGLIAGVDRLTQQEWAKPVKQFEKSIESGLSAVFNVLGSAGSFVLGPFADTIRQSIFERAGDWIETQYNKGARSGAGWAMLAEALLPTSLYKRAAYTTKRTAWGMEPFIYGNTRAYQRDKNFQGLLRTSYVTPEIDIVHPFILGRPSGYKELAFYERYMKISPTGRQSAGVLANFTPQAVYPLSQTLYLALQRRQWRSDYEQYGRLMRQPHKGDSNLLANMLNQLMSITDTSKNYSAYQNVLEMVSDSKALVQDAFSPSNTRQLSREFGPDLFRDLYSNAMRPVEWMLNLPSDIFKGLQTLLTSLRPPGGGAAQTVTEAANNAAETPAKRNLFQRVIDRIKSVRNFKFNEFVSENWTKLNNWYENYNFEKQGRKTMVERLGALSARAIGFGINTIKFFGKPFGWLRRWVGSFKTPVHPQVAALTDTATQTAANVAENTDGAPAAAASDSLRTRMEAVEVAKRPNRLKQGLSSAAEAVKAADAGRLSRLKQRIFDGVGSLLRGSLALGSFALDTWVAASDITRQQNLDIKTATGYQAEKVYGDQTASIFGGLAALGAMYSGFGFLGTLAVWAGASLFGYEVGKKLSHKDMDKEEKFYGNLLNPVQVATTALSTAFQIYSWRTGAFRGRPSQTGISESGEAVFRLNRSALKAYVGHRTKPTGIGRFLPRFIEPKGTMRQMRAELEVFHERFHAKQIKLAAQEGFRGYKAQAVLDSVDELRGRYGDNAGAYVERIDRLAQRSAQSLLRQYRGLNAVQYQQIYEQEFEAYTKANLKQAELYGDKQAFKILRATDRAYSRGRAEGYVSYQGRFRGLRDRLGINATKIKADTPFEVPEYRYASAAQIDTDVERVSTEPQDAQTKAENHADVRNTQVRRNLRATLRRRFQQLVDIGYGRLPEPIKLNQADYANKIAYSDINLRYGGRSAALAAVVAFTAGALQREGDLKDRLGQGLLFSGLGAAFIYADRQLSQLRSYLRPTVDLRSSVVGADVKASDLSLYRRGIRAGLDVSNLKVPVVKSNWSIGGSVTKILQSFAAYTAFSEAVGISEDYRSGNIQQAQQRESSAVTGATAMLLSQLVTRNFFVSLAVGLFSGAAAEKLGVNKLLGQDRDSAAVSSGALVRLNRNYDFIQNITVPTLQQYSSRKIAANYAKSIYQAVDAKSGDRLSRLSARVRKTYSTSRKVFQALREGKPIESVKNFFSGVADVYRNIRFFIEEVNRGRPVKPNNAASLTYADEIPPERALVPYDAFEAEEAARKARLAAQPFRIRLLNSIREFLALDPIDPEPKPRIKNYYDEGGLNINFLSKGRKRSAQSPPAAKLKPIVDDQPLSQRLNEWFKSRFSGFTSFSSSNRQPKPPGIKSYYDEGGLNINFLKPGRKAKEPVYIPELDDTPPLFERLKSGFTDFFKPGSLRKILSRKRSPRGANFSEVGLSINFMRPGRKAPDPYLDFIKATESMAEADSDRAVSRRQPWWRRLSARMANLSFGRTRAALVNTATESAAEKSVQKASKVGLYYDSTDVNFLSRRAAEKSVQKASKAGLYYDSTDVNFLSRRAAGPKPETALSRYLSELREINIVEAFTDLLRAPFDAYKMRQAIKKEQILLQEAIDYRYRDDPEYLLNRQKEDPSFFRRQWLKIQSQQAKKAEARNRRYAMDLNLLRFRKKPEIKNEKLELGKLFANFKDSAYSALKESGAAFKAGFKDLAFTTSKSILTRVDKLDRRLAATPILGKPYSKVSKASRASAAIDGRFNASMNVLGYGLDALMFTSSLAAISKNSSKEDYLAAYQSATLASRSFVGSIAGIPLGPVGELTGSLILPMVLGYDKKAAERSYVLGENGFQMGLRIAEDASRDLKIFSGLSYFFAKAASPAISRFFANRPKLRAGAGLLGGGFLGYNVGGALFGLGGSLIDSVFGTEIQDEAEKVGQGVGALLGASAGLKLSLMGGRAQAAAQLAQNQKIAANLARSRGYTLGTSLPAGFTPYTPRARSLPLGSGAARPVGVVLPPANTRTTVLSILDEALTANRGSGPTFGQFAQTADLVDEVIPNQTFGQFIGTQPKVGPTFRQFINPGAGPRFAEFAAAQRSAAVPSGPTFGQAFGPRARVQTIPTVPFGQFTGRQTPFGPKVGPAPSIPKAPVLAGSGNSAQVAGRFAQYSRTVKLLRSVAKGAGNVGYVLQVGVIGLSAYQLATAENEEQKAAASSNLRGAVGALVGGLIGTFVGGKIGFALAARYGAPAGPKGALAAGSVGMVGGGLIGGGIGTELGDYLARGDFESAGEVLNKTFNALKSGKYLPTQEKSDKEKTLELLEGRRNEVWDNIKGWTGSAAKAIGNFYSSVASKLGRNASAFYANPNLLGLGLTFALNNASQIGAGLRDQLKTAYGYLTPNQGTLYASVVSDTPMFETQQQRQAQDKDHWMSKLFSAFGNFARMSIGAARQLFTNATRIPQWIGNQVRSGVGFIGAQLKRIMGWAGRQGSRIGNFFRSVFGGGSSGGGRGWRGWSGGGGSQAVDYGTQMELRRQEIGGKLLSAAGIPFTGKRRTGLVRGGEQEMALLKIALAEASGEGVEGMALVIRSIFNRKAVIDAGGAGLGHYSNDGGMPDSSFKSIIEEGGGGQYSPVAPGGGYWAARSATELATARRALELALNDAELRRRLAAFGMKEGEIKNLMEATNFNNPNAAVNATPGYKNAQFKRHLFNQDFYAARLNMTQTLNKAFKPLADGATRLGKFNSKEFFKGANELVDWLAEAFPDLTNGARVKPQKIYGRPNDGAVLQIPFGAGLKWFGSGHHSHNPGEREYGMPFDVYIGSATPNGTLRGGEIYNPTMARLEEARFIDGYGYTVILHDMQGKRLALLAHFAELNPALLSMKRGAVLKPGFRLGTEGITGQPADPMQVHLHFETRSDAWWNEFVRAHTTGRFGAGNNQASIYEKIKKTLKDGGYVGDNLKAILKGFAEQNQVPKEIINRMLAQVDEYNRTGANAQLRNEALARIAAGQDANLITSQMVIQALSPYNLEGKLTATMPLINRTDPTAAARAAGGSVVKEERVLSISHLNKKTGQPILTTKDLKPLFKGQKVTKDTPDWWNAFVSYAPGLMASSLLSSEFIKDKTFENFYRLAINTGGRDRFLSRREALLAKQIRAEFAKIKNFDPKKIEDLKLDTKQEELLDQVDKRAEAALKDYLAIQHAQDWVLFGSAGQKLIKLDHHYATFVMQGGGRDREFSSRERSLQEQLNKQFYQTVEVGAKLLQSDLSKQQRQNYEREKSKVQTSIAFTQLEFYSTQLKQGEYLQITEGWRNLSARQIFELIAAGGEDNVVDAAERALLEQLKTYDPDYAKARGIKLDSKRLRFTLFDIRKRFLAMQRKAFKGPASEAAKFGMRRPLGTSHIGPNGMPILQPHAKNKRPYQGEKLLGYESNWWEKFVHFSPKGKTVSVDLANFNGEEFYQMAINTGGADGRLTASEVQFANELRDVKGRPNAIEQEAATRYYAIQRAADWQFFEPSVQKALPLDPNYANIVMLGGGRDRELSSQEMSLFKRHREILGKLTNLDNVKTVDPRRKKFNEAQRKAYLKTLEYQQLGFYGLNLRRNAHLALADPEAQFTTQELYALISSGGANGYLDKYEMKLANEAFELDPEVRKLRKQKELLPIQQSLAQYQIAYKFMRHQAQRIRRDRKNHWFYNLYDRLFGEYDLSGYDMPELQGKFFIPGRVTDAVDNFRIQRFKQRQEERQRQKAEKQKQLLDQYVDPTLFRPVTPRIYTAFEPVQIIPSLKAALEKVPVAPRKPNLGEALFMFQIGRILPGYQVEPPKPKPPAASPTKPGSAPVWSSDRSIFSTKVTFNGSSLKGKEAEIAAMAIERAYVHESRYSKRLDKDVYGNDAPLVPNLIVLHETVGTKESTLNLFSSNKGNMGSYHVGVDFTGLRTRFVDDENRAYGAKSSLFPGDRAVTVTDESAKAAEQRRLTQEQNMRLGNVSVNNHALHLTFFNRTENDTNWTDGHYIGAALQIAEWQVKYGIGWDRVTSHEKVDAVGGMFKNEPGGLQPERSDPRRLDWNRLRKQTEKFKPLFQKGGALANATQEQKMAVVGLMSDPMGILFGGPAVAAETSPSSTRVLKAQPNFFNNAFSFYKQGMGRVLKAAASSPLGWALQTGGRNLKSAASAGFEFIFGGAARASEVPNPLTLDIIKREEGLAKERSDGMIEAYLCAANVWTIGYGTTVMDGKPVRPGDVITKNQAEQYLRRDASAFQEKISKTIPYWKEMNPVQQSVMMSFAYNFGPYFMEAPGFESIQRNLREKDWDAIPDTLMKYKFGAGSALEGLTRRRMREGELWRSSLQLEEDIRRRAREVALPIQAFLLQAAVGGGRAPTKMIGDSRVKASAIQKQAELLSPDKREIIFKAMDAVVQELDEAAEKVQKIVKDTSEVVRNIQPWSYAIERLGDFVEESFSPMTTFPNFMSRVNRRNRTDRRSRVTITTKYNSQFQPVRPYNRGPLKSHPPQRGQQRRLYGRRTVKVQVKEQQRTGSNANNRRANTRPERWFLDPRGWFGW